MRSRERRQSERPETIRMQLDRILASREFSQSPSLSRLLGHLVDAAIRGDAEGLKEYTLGVEVFERGEDFDPKTDTIVRVQARRLRQKLDAYYATEGKNDPLRIRIPKGRYVAEIESSDTVTSALRLLRPSLSPPRPLSIPRNALIGRDEDLGNVVRLLSGPKARLLTLTGSGGSGKTRLALEAARQVSDHFPGGVYFVELASIADPTTLASVLAQVFGTPRSGPRPLADALADHLRDAVSGPTLLVVDNFEHLMPASGLIASILDQAADLRVLVTSREVLRLYGESEYPIHPLPVPDDVVDYSAVAENPSVMLFVERARAVRPNFTLTEKNVSAVVAICTRLDGLPLAIELAAPHIRMFSPENLYERLEGNLDLLTSRARDVPERQQTLRRTIAWSYDLLDEPEQQLLRRLSVLVGGSTLESAEAVADTRRDLGVRVPEGIQSLVDKSLMRVAGPGIADGGPRFVMTETVRDFAAEKLSDSGEEPATRQALAAYALVVAEEGNTHAPGTEGRQRWITLCDQELDNLRAALDWVITSRNSDWALHLGVALYAYWERREFFDEARHWLEPIVNMGSVSPSTLRARAVSYLGTVSGHSGLNVRLHEESLRIFEELGDLKGMVGQWGALAMKCTWSGDDSAAAEYFERSLDACRELGEQLEIAGAASNLAVVVMRLGEFARARALLNEAMEIFETISNPSGVAWTFNRLGDLHRRRGNLSDAAEAYSKAQAVFVETGDRWGIARTSLDSGHLALRKGDTALARTRFREALQFYLDLAHRRGVAMTFLGFARMAIAQDRPKRALTLAGAADAACRRGGWPVPPHERAELDRLLGSSPVQGLDEVAQEALRHRGAGMSLDEAVQFALEPDATDNRDTPSPPARDPKPTIGS